jgi:hypothetical protein
MVDRAELAEVRTVSKERRWYTPGFPLRGGRTALSLGPSDVSNKGEIIAITTTKIFRVIGRKSQDLEAEAAYLPLCGGQMEIGQRSTEWIERPPVIAEFDLDPLAVEGEHDLDPARPSHVVVAVFDDIGE